MRCVLVATGDTPGLAALGQTRPAPLTWFFDRPFVQHVLEWLVRQGAKALEIVVCEGAEQVEAALGDGERWGVALSYHLVRDPALPYGVLHRLGLDEGEGEAVLLGHADTLPLLPLPAPEGGPLAFVAPGADGAEEWTGWAWLGPAELRALSLGEDRATLGAGVLAACPEGHRLAVGDRLLAADSVARYLAAHGRALDGLAHELLLTGREVQPGVWIARNVAIDPSARVTPPVYIGANSTLGAQVELGPRAVVGADCVIERGTTVAEAVVLPRSYVGEGLEVREAIVDRNRLASVRLDGVTTVRDDFILGAVQQPALAPTLAAALQRIAGAGLLAADAPLLAGTLAYLKLARPGPLVHRRPVVALPAADAEAPASFELLSLAPEGEARRGLAHLLLRALPALLHVARGELGLVGVPPRSAADVAALPAEWRALYLGARAGVIDEALLADGELDEDARYATEAFYQAVRGPGYDLRVLLNYLALALLGRAPLSLRRGSVELPAEEVSS